MTQGGLEKKTVIGTARAGGAGGSPIGTTP